MKQQEKKKYRYTFDLILREHTRVSGIENENIVTATHYKNHEPQRIEHAIAGLFDGLSRDGHIDRTLYHLANFEAKEGEANESVRKQVDRYVSYLLNYKKIIPKGDHARTKGHTDNPND